MAEDDLPPPPPPPDEDPPPGSPIVHFFAGDPPTYRGSARIAAGAEIPPDATLIPPPASWPGNTIIWNGEAWERIADGEVAGRRAPPPETPPEDEGSIDA